MEYEPSRMDCTADGVRGFFWPVARSELVDAARFTMLTIVQTLREGVQTGDKDALSLSTVSTKFLLECVSVFQAALLAKRFRNAAYLDIPKEARIWRAAFSDNDPGESAFVRALRNGLKESPTWRRFLRPLRGVRSKDCFLRRPIEMVDGDTDIVCVTACPLTRTHALEAQTRVILCPLSEWFPPPDRDSAWRNARATSRYREALLGALYEGFEKRGCHIPGNLMEYLRSFLIEATWWVRYYETRLQTSQIIPRRLWIGTGGIIWSRMLANCVRRQGGVVTGHDHAWGACYSEWTSVPFTEFQSCDVFWTFSEKQVRLYEEAGPAQCISGYVPQIQFPRGGMRSVENVRSGRKGAKRIRTSVGGGRYSTILYITPFYPLDVVGPQPLMSAPVAVDWQLRLFRMLKELGHEILYKPHPESPLKPPAAFQEIFGARELRGRFESVYEKADVLIFDYPLTTTFGFALRTDKPVVLIDFQFVRLPYEDRVKLEDRCGIVRAWYDEENRAQVERDRLAAAIRLATSLRGGEFVEDVLGG